MVDKRALSNLQNAVDDLGAGNPPAAMRFLDYGVNSWPDHCDLHRAVAFARWQETGETTGTPAIAAIHHSLASFDEMVKVLNPSMIESWFATSWTLPLVEINLPLTTRGLVRAAHAANLVEQGRYDEARAELDAARVEVVARTENTAVTSGGIAAVECLLYFRTARWENLLSASSPLVSAGAGAGSSSSETEAIFGALGNAFGGAALTHLGNHAAGQAKLRTAIEAGFVSIAAWAALQLGLSLRTAGDEEAAQKAFATGLQFSALPELLGATRDVNHVLRVTTPELITARTSFWDPATEPDPAEFHRVSSQDDRTQVLAGALKELERLEGMDDIKQRVREIAAEIRVENERRRRGMVNKPKSRHMIFTGPPGTGKTTVAQLIAKLLYGLGVIPKPTLKQTERVEIVGTVWGEAGSNMKRFLEEARGGVFFIDEAYGLVQEVGPGQKDPYGEEALTTLLNHMELWRDELVVVVAGYRQEMERFLNSNEGFRSRFPVKIDFHTYTPDEMWKIFNGMAVEGEKKIDPDTEATFLRVIEMMRLEDHNSKTFLDRAGNGRFARNVFELAQSKASLRLDSTEDLTLLSDEDLATLTEADIVAAMRELLSSYDLPGVLG